MKTKMSEDVRVKLAVYRPIFDKIVVTICDKMNINPAEIGIRDRHGNYPKARQAVCYYTYNLTKKKCSMSLIGYMLNPSNPFDHSHIHYFISHFEKLLRMKKPGYYFLNGGLRTDDWIMKIRINFELYGGDGTVWLENFATSSGNFMMSEAV